MLPVESHPLCCRLQTEGLPWTQLMDASLLAAHSKHEATAADIIAACQKIPMDGALQEVSPLAAAFMSLPFHPYPLTARPEPGGLEVDKVPLQWLQKGLAGNRLIWLHRYCERLDH